jgi:hypothetical protein
MHIIIIIIVIIIIIIVYHCIIINTQGQMVNRPLANAQNFGPMTKYAGRNVYSSPAYYWFGQANITPFPLTNQKSGSQ